ncbi:MAG: FAD-binding oxidoreductase [bacterium]|nr:FAD-binding oxidoreductase [bacterium]
MSNEFLPNWSNEAPAAGSYRSIFKWGAPGEFKHPNRKLYAYLKDNFGLTDADFEKKEHEGRELVKLEGKPVGIDAVHVGELENIVGVDNVSTADFERLKFSTGKTMEEANELRRNIVKEVCDVVVHPRNKGEVAQIVDYCNRNRLPLYVYGGGSSVTLGLRAVGGGITLVLSTHMNKILHLNETNKTCTVEAGMMGPAYEAALNGAQEILGAGRNYTCGHFPQSFEYSSVGGWVVTLGSGQQSSYYGDAGDIVIGVEVITPAGHFKTHEFPATATGPKVLEMFKGSEGAFGVVVELTMKVFFHLPENQKGFGFMFPTWSAGIDACREISQGEFGFPGVMRISDEEETDMGLKLYGIDGTVLDKLMRARGFKPMKRALFLARTDGEKGFAKNVKKKAMKICRKHGGMYLTSYPIKKWEKGRYRDPYLREDLSDFGFVLDTLESAVTWDNVHELHLSVRKFIKSFPYTACLTHASHFYPQGTNLYFIFYRRMGDLAEYKQFHDGIIDAMVKNGGSMSHHHGVGKLMAPWMEPHLGSGQTGALNALKKHFDPSNIMNPGQLGLSSVSSRMKSFTSTTK